MLNDMDLLKVLLVDSDTARSALLSQALQDQGYEVIARVQPGANLLAMIANFMPDMVVIDTDSPDRDMLESMSLLNQHNPMPVVMFADEDNDVVVREAIRSGVSGYVARNTDSKRVRSIMQVAIARFREYQALKNELSQTKNELEKGKLLQKAKSLLIKHKKVTEDEAHQAIQKLSMDQNKSVVEVAENIISVLEMSL
ncbi:MAG: ANTAR domain-containing protein [Thiotrichales bacterium]|nr:ANTAR domain-containing protein [Thiotrichales bacterium]